MIRPKTLMFGAQVEVLGAQMERPRVETFCERVWRHVCASVLDLHMGAFFVSASQSA